MTWIDVGFLKDAKYLNRDRDTKFCKTFQGKMKGGGVECLKLPAQSPNLNAFVGRWVKTIKEESLSKIILFGEDTLRRVLNEFETHYNHERPHQEVGNVILFPRDDGGGAGPPIQCRERLGGLLQYYYNRAG